jgi:hypothetical protein
VVVPLLVAVPEEVLLDELEVLELDVPLELLVELLLDVPLEVPVLVDSFVDSLSAICSTTA